MNKAGGREGVQGEVTAAGKAWCWSLSRVQLCNPMDCNLPGSSAMGFSRQEYRSALPCPSPGDLPNPGTEPGAPELQADSLPSELPGKLYRGMKSSKSMGPWGQTAYTWGEGPVGDRAAGGLGSSAGPGESIPLGLAVLAEALQEGCQGQVSRTRWGTVQGAVWQPVPQPRRAHGWAGGTTV